jgi:hypothetical protein
MVDCVADSGRISSEKSLIPLILSLLSESRFAQGFATPLRSPSLAHRSKGCFLATAISGMLPRRPRDRKWEERAQTENLRAPRGGCELWGISGGGIYSARSLVAQRRGSLERGGLKLWRPVFKLKGSFDYLAPQRSHSASILSDYDSTHMCSVVTPEHGLSLHHVILLPFYPRIKDVFYTIFIARCLCRLSHWTPLYPHTSYSILKHPKY